MLSTNHIMPDCPSAPPPAFHGVPTWVLGWGMGLGTVLIILAGVLIAYWIECRADVKKSHANAEMSTCPTWQAAQDATDQTDEERDLGQRYIDRVRAPRDLSDEDQTAIQQLLKNERDC